MQLDEGSLRRSGREVRAVRWRSSPIAGEQGGNRGEEVAYRGGLAGCGLRVTATERVATGRLQPTPITPLCFTLDARRTTDHREELPLVMIQRRRERLSVEPQPAQHSLPLGASRQLGG